MYYHSQNLTDGRLAKFWHGRAWLHTGEPYKSRQLHWEWSFGKLARDFAATLTFGNGDDAAGILLHLCIPWLFSIFFGWDGFLRLEKECHTGVAIHNGGFWLYLLPYTMESNRDDPWWRRYYHWPFPWTWDWWSTEILSHGPNTGDLRVVWSETAKHREPFLKSWDKRKAAEQAVSVDYPYAYIRKNRDIQRVTANVHVSRMTWRARWWPLIPLRKTRTYIDVEFDQGVGEGTGSWKGGVTECSHEMKWGESPERCLSRMEHEREFRR